MLYNSCIMKIKQKPQKTRAHIVLFLTNSPFKSRTVELKTRFKRQEKHRNREHFG
jgi:hypothetical protein